MAADKLMKCKDCEAEISKRAESCPHCGAKVKKSPGFWSWLITILIIIWVISAISPNSPMTNATMQSITDKVAQDAVDQYEIAKRGGSDMDACVQAGMVKAAFLQAKDNENYNQWNAVERNDCARAGISK